MAIGGSKKKAPAKEKTPEQQFLVKRCPECFVSLPIDAKRCFSCKSRVGPVDRHGKAKRPINWYSYALCILSWAAFLLYIKWAFF